MSSCEAIRRSSGAHGKSSEAHQKLAACVDKMKQFELPTASGSSMDHLTNKTDASKPIQSEHMNVPE